MKLLLLGEQTVSRSMELKEVELFQRAIDFYASKGWMTIALSNQFDEELDLEGIIQSLQSAAILMPKVYCFLFCYDIQGNQIWEVGRDYAHLYVREGENRGFDPFDKPNVGQVQFACSPYFFENAPEEVWLVGNSVDQKMSKLSQVKFCPVELFQKRFSSGLQTLMNISVDQVRFLEGI